ncbi:tyrosine recombinase XerC [Acinetobacter nectaris]|uniref:tyrosine recombinase XerC n=1 Tax=Acinetobacter nectaris TaxID=1219382 RepID=UPI001F3DFEFF|nr:tyrosine recombinase XerC [Acinetobacter nectaris]MCF9027450.1 tyrosine recombinase XerC [Acinetobacter nectaris]
MDTVWHWLENWLISRRNQNQSIQTIQAYSRDVTDFLKFCEAKKLDIYAIETSDLREFLTFKVEQGRLGRSSLQRQLSAIRQFMKWVSENHLISQNITKDFQLKRHARPLPGLVDPETIIQILEQPAPQSEVQRQLWLRDKALLELLYSSGIRLSEIQGLTFKDIDFQRKLIRITGKGNKTRIVPFGESAKSAILAWLQIYQLWKGKFKPDDAVFISQHSGEALGVRQIEKRVKFQAQRAGVNVDLHPHLLRHCFASHLLSGSGDLRAVQEMLGHSNLSTTQIYTHLDFDRLASVYDQAHPRAQKVKADT